MDTQIDPQSMKKLTSKKYKEYKNTSGKGFIYVLKVKKLLDGKENGDTIRWEGKEH